MKKVRYSIRYLIKPRFLKPIRSFAMQGLDGSWEEKELGGDLLSQIWGYRLQFCKMLRATISSVVK